MKLLERDQYLHQLNAAHAEAVAGRGNAVLVLGEAGVGKTALIEAFTADVQERDRRSRVLWGACDALLTPRPLGPLLDMARQSPGPLKEFTRIGSDRERLFSALLDELSRAAGSTIAIFEDVHWADEATLDLLKFLVRRISRTSGMLVLTSRADESGVPRTLQALLGAIPTASVSRLHLQPLSKAAVARLAAHRGRAYDELFEVTGGNPFFVTEVLASDIAGVPPSVRDAVLARAAGLGTSSLQLLDLVSVVPGRAERWLTGGLTRQSNDAIHETVQAGLLRVSGEHLEFRHELARRAWQDSLAPLHRADLHARVLRALESRKNEAGTLPRLVYHADQIGKGAIVRRLAAAAAAEAAALGAHREAAAHLESALRYVHESEPEERARLLDAWSYEVHLGGRIADAVRARAEALALWRAIGNQRREGDALRWLSRLAWFEGRREDSVASAEEAIRVLEPLGACHELAMAYSNKAQLHILLEERRLAAEWGDRAVAMAEAIGDPEVLVHALTNAACLEPGASREMQVRAARLAQRHDLQEHAMRAFTWLVCDAITEQDYALADVFLGEALEYAESRDMDTYALYLRGWRARMWMETGRWNDAVAEATTVLLYNDSSIVVRLPALTVLGTIRMRRGEGGADAILDEALELALSTGELQRLAPVAAARAESAWLRGDAEGVRIEIMRALPMAIRAESPWDLGRLSRWLHRIGTGVEVPHELPPPFALEVSGKWRAAADAWKRRGCPYDQALALALGDEPSQRAALAILDGLAAGPASAMVRRRLRQMGARGLPRGPRKSTRANPSGLTNRQVEVLELLAQGLTNGEIGQRLYLSTRTVDHHVSALLQKLNASSRVAAARRASEVLGEREREAGGPGRPAR